MEPSTYVDIVVAVATLGLAFATWRLAIHTRAMAKETRDEATAVRDQVSVANTQVNVSESAYRAAIMPWLTVAPYDDPNLRLLRREVAARPFLAGTGGSIEVTNIGNGLAVIPEGGVTVVQVSSVQSEKLLMFPGAASPPSVGIGARSVISFRIPHDSAQAASLTLDDFAQRTVNSTGGFLIEVRFSDATGGQPLRARFHAFGDAEGRYHIHKVSYLRNQDETPFTTAGVGWQETTEDAS